MLYIDKNYIYERNLPYYHNNLTSHACVRTGNVTFDASLDNVALIPCNMKTQKTPSA